MCAASRGTKIIGGAKWLLLPNLTSLFYIVGHIQLTLILNGPYQCKEV